MRFLEEKWLKKRMKITTRRGQIFAYYTPPLFDNLSKLEQFYSNEGDKERPHSLYVCLYV